MVESFVDIGSTRVLLGTVPSEGLPEFRLGFFSALDTLPEEDKVVSTLLPMVEEMKREGKALPKKVWVVLGLGRVSAQRRKTTRVLSSRSRVRVKRSHLQGLHLELLKDVLKKGEFFLGTETSSVELDGIASPYLPDDRDSFAHTISLTEFVFSLPGEDLWRVKSILRRTNLKVKGFLVRELLVSKACFSPRELEKGAILIDIGYSRTALVFWKNSRLIEVKIFPYGGKDVTSSIMREFGVPFAVAEDLKRRFVATESLSLDEGKVIVEVEGRRYEVPKVRLSQVIHDCVSSILEEIRANMFTWHVSLDEVVVALTGGVCSMDGVVETGERILGLPTRMAFCKNQSCIASLPSSPYALILGAFWQFVEGKINFPKLGWKERVWLWGKEMWDFF